MTTSHINERPFKVWSHDRELRKSLIASSLIEFKLKAAEKLGFGNVNVNDLQVVLESDGTEIEEDSYFQLSEKNTIFLLLRADEKWLPPGVEALKAAINSLPSIVCDAMSKMQLIEKPTTWKLIDNRGNITIILHWNSKDRGLPLIGEPTWRVKLVSDQKPSKTKAQQPIISTIITPSTSTTLRSKLSLDGIKSRSTPPPPSTDTLPKLIDYDDDDDDDEDLFDYDKQDPDLLHAHDHSKCDFHCAALHREGGQIQVNRSIATSPIQDFATAITSRSSSPSSSAVTAIFTTASGTIIETVTTSISPLLSATPTTQPIATTSSMHSSADQQLAGKKPSGKGHVRFMDVEVKKIYTTSSTTTTASNNSDSETETNEKEDEQICERYLLLVDQLSDNRDNHLTIKDLGIILERLNSKIIDVDKLEREKEGPDCYNWIIKATLKGEILREIGVIYNGQYYGITEHPGYF